MILLIKNVFLKIKNSIGRFTSIMLIIALGISVFIGLYESTAGMLFTADNYYDKNNLMDFKITSTHGLTKGDVKSLEGINNVEKAIPSYSVDVLDSGKSIRVHAIEKEVNNVVLMQGKMPKKNNECLADYYKYKLKDEIIFKNDDLKSFLSINKCKVVGLIKSPLYIREEKGISNIGNGKLISYVFVKKDVFISEFYTEIYLLSDATKKKSSYYEEYNKALKPLKKELEKIKPIRETIRYEEILEKASNEIIKIENELNEKIKDNLVTLKKSKKQLDNEKKKTDDLTAEKTTFFDSNLITLNDQRNNLLIEMNKLGANENNIDEVIINTKTEITNLNNLLLTLPEGSDEYNNIKTNITLLEQKLNALNTMKDNLIKINNNKNVLEQNYLTFKKEIASANEKITDGYNKYNDGLIEIDKAKNEANEKILEAKAELNNIEKPKWYLLNRKDNSGYISYKEDIIKVEAISKVLPIFFILVVILMVSNTLNRIVEEERTEMGILLANGFSTSAIMFEYILYVLISGLIGLTLGLVVGYAFIPKIIYGVFLSRYYVPKLITIVSPLPFSMVILLTLIIMLVVSITTCYKELKNMPAALLRYKPPKVGKKVFFERFPKLWSRISFMWKTTVRNIFRYKKRIIMTVLGVAGCTALLVAGMGINDSIYTISKLQYEDIIKYDSMYILKNSVEEIPSNILTLFRENEIVNPLLINQEAFTFTFDNKTEDIFLIVPKDSVNFNNYVNLKSVVNDKKITIKDDGAIISKQTADLLKVKIGESIKIRNSDNELFILKVNDITENYVSHYIYINKNYYEKIFEEEISYNSIIGNGKIDDKIELSKYNILIANYTEDIVRTFNEFVHGLNKIIILIVVLASLLAFVVLYNLTIINVSERKREIATFKVLGFYDKEINIFVYREILILTLFGIIYGLIFGKYLHIFIMNTAETDNIVFLREIRPLSYIICILLTLIFSLIVQTIMNKTLKKIDMIDSLKSVE
ncbi:MAG: FtsX-like permease family protein [Mollicutes bacterium]|nr:FtsX-like permease family protein [Mollicutes bacterium]